MRMLLIAVGVIAAALILLGLLLEAARWLVLIGAVALIGVFVLSLVKTRRILR